MSKIKANIQDILSTIQKKSPHPASVKLIIVTKNRSIEEIQEIIRLGITIIGENRIQEAEAKFPLLKSPINKHLIGHLQSNKVKLAIALFDMIQSVDSFKIAEYINKEAQKIGKVMPVLVQVNISQDPGKFGFKEKETLHSFQQLISLKNIHIQGLMTIGRLSNNREEIRYYFRNLRQLYEQIKKENISGVDMTYLSMGMSDDYEIALEEGSNMIRVGRKIFE